MRTLIRIKYNNTADTRAPYSGYKYDDFVSDTRRKHDSTRDKLPSNTILFDIEFNRDSRIIRTYCQKLKLFSKCGIYIGILK